VYSEKDRGTTFRIYLPRYLEKKGIVDGESQIEIAQGKGETILIVEDDLDVIEMVRLMLEQLGYRVLAANTPSEALLLAKIHIYNIHLLLTDVVMPEMNGRDLAYEIKIINPDIKILFMSGYIANFTSNGRFSDQEVNLLQKPFSLKELSVNVRNILEK
ncbi:MAG: response regulator, partial [Desulfamplus sp.]|nr:response regulator [Desulfamplus sp.]